MRHFETSGRKKDWHVVEMFGVDSASRGTPVSFSGSELNRSGLRSLSHSNELQALRGSLWSPRDEMK